MEETEKYRKKPEKDSFMNELNMSGDSRNKKEPLNRTLGKQFGNNFKTLLDEDEEGDEDEEYQQP